MPLSHENRDVRVSGEIMIRRSLSAHGVPPIVRRLCRANRRSCAGRPGGKSMSEAQNERWLTYVELGALLRCTPPHACMRGGTDGFGVRRT